MGVMRMQVWRVCKRIWPLPTGRSGPAKGTHMDVRQEGGPCAGHAGWQRWTCIHCTAAASATDWPASSMLSCSSLLWAFSWCLLCRLSPTFSWPWSRFVLLVQLRGWLVHCALYAWHLRVTPSLYAWPLHAPQSVISAACIPRPHPSLSLFHSKSGRGWGHSSVCVRLGEILSAAFCADWSQQNTSASSLPCARRSSDNGKHRSLPAHWSQT